MFARIAVLIVGAAAVLALAAPLGRPVVYLAGTVNGFGDNVHGRMDLNNAEHLSFTAKDGRTFEVPWKRIVSVSYGQKAERRLGWAIAVSPMLRMSQRRQHYVTIRYTDASGKTEGMLLEVGKNDIASDLVVLAARVGKPVQFESADAKSHIHG